MNFCCALNKDLTLKLALGCPELRILNLSSTTGIDDDSIETFSTHLKKLTKIVLDYLPITGNYSSISPFPVNLNLDKAIEYLATYTSRLTSLSICGCNKITDKINDELNKFSFLRTFSCSLSSRITRLYFSQNLENLEILNARKCSSLTTIDGTYQSIC